MKNIVQKITLLTLSVVSLFSCSSEPQNTTVASPGNNITLNFNLDENGAPTYLVFKENEALIAKSSLGFRVADANYSDGFTLREVKKGNYEETWDPVWGQQSKVNNHYNFMVVDLHNAEGKELSIEFRLYDDGLGFRYNFLGEDSLTILDENTTFNFTADHKTWWTPGCWDNDEYPYTESKLSEVDASYFIDGYPYSNVTTIVDKHSVNTPVTLKTERGDYISIHEAALLNFPGMSLKVDIEKLNLKSMLAEKEKKQGVKAEVQLPFSTPWRTIQLASNAGDLTTSYLIQNLNEPNKLKDVSWIEPMKYTGIWWEMHVGKSDWAMASGKHGATTENAKRYIDFSAANGIRGVLIEGWNTGWEDWTGDDREGIFDFQTPYSDFDLREVVRYATSKGVKIIGHHETASAVNTYEKYMTDAYKLYEELGINAVKTGYVGKIPGYRHYEQKMVNHYNESMEQTAKHKIMLDIHEPIKQTGLCRTYPNLISAEGMRGQEFNAWSDGNKPSHNVTLPFTRMLAGPMDFTPGIFDLKLEKYKNTVTKVSGFDSREGEEAPYSRVYSTLAHQLALYVVFYSPVQMAADLPENYEGNPAFQFIRDVAVDWDWSKVTDAEIASHIVTVRKAKDLKEWYIGGIAGDQGHTTALSFDFLEEGKTYEGILYKDAVNTDYMSNPEEIAIETIELTKGSILPIEMKPAGGFALSIK